MNITIPHIIKFPKLGQKSTGYISVAEIDKDIPFKIKRVYWTYLTPADVQRGFHSHKNLSQVIVSVSGEISFKIINNQGKISNFILDKPNKGLFIPKNFWREIRFSNEAVLLCMASEKYEENDYIRSYDEFLNLL